MESAGASGTRGLRWAPAVAGGAAVRRGQVLLADLDAVADPGAWAARVRAAGRVAAVAVEVGRLGPDLLARLDALGPILLVVRPGAEDDQAAWDALRAHLATARLPLLRLAEQGNAACHVLPTRLELSLVPPLRPAGSRDRRCTACALVADCPGPDGPGQPVAPLPVPVSNQFDLVAEAAHRLSDDAEPCPAAIGEVSDPALPAEVWLRGAGVLQVFRTRSVLWPVDAVAATVARGQLYLDVSIKARLDDFAADLRLLEPAHAPHPTDAGGGCPGAWQVAARQPFAEEEATLRAWLGRLRGTVVDVGAGPIRYLGELRQKMAEGTLRYVAVEPDPAALRRGRADLPEGLMLQGSGEHLPLADGCADAVLFLRSYNHLRDVPAALGEAARVLRPGGLLVLVDNVAFGLLRSPEQLARAHAIGPDETPFEHYRNADAAEALTALEAAAEGRWRLRAVADVAPGRSNQWLIVAERGAAGRNGASPVEAAAPAL